MKTRTALSRRRLLASVPAVAAMAVPTATTALCRLPAGGDDPVFAAIEAHHKAMSELSAAYKTQCDIEEETGEWNSTDTDDDADRHQKAMLAFLTTAPVTMAGAIAALEYAASPMFPNEKGDHDKETIQLDGMATMDGEFIEASTQFPAMIAEALRKMTAV